MLSWAGLRAAAAVSAATPESTNYEWALLLILQTQFLKESFLILHLFINRKKDLSRKITKIGN